MHHYVGFSQIGSHVEVHISCNFTTSPSLYYNFVYVCNLTLKYRYSLWILILSLTRLWVCWTTLSQGYNSLVIALLVGNNLVSTLSCTTMFIINNIITTLSPSSYNLVTTLFTVPNLFAALPEFCTTLSFLYGYAYCHSLHSQQSSHCCFLWSHFFVLFYTQYGGAKCF